MRSKFRKERSGDHGMLYVTLKSYLSQLAAQQRSLPEHERTHVPTMEELADSIGISSVTLSNIVSGKTKLLNLDIGAHIITELQRLGFNTAVSDIISYRPPAKKE